MKAVDSMRIEQLWEKNYQLAKEFYESNGHLRIPISYVVDGYHIGIWIHNMKEAYNGKNTLNLTPQKIKLLEEIKIEWSIHDNVWLANYQKLLENSTGENIKNILENDELKQWIRKQKESYVNGTLPDARRCFVEKNINIFNIFYLKWEYYYYLAKQFYEQYHHLNIPLKYKINDINLGYWIAAQRDSYVKRLLTQEQIERLEKIGMIWCISEYCFIHNTIDKFNKKKYYQKLERRLYKFLEQQSCSIFTEKKDINDLEKNFQKYLNYVKK